MVVVNVGVNVVVEGGVCVIAAECVCVLIMVVVEMRQGRLRQRRMGRKKMGVCVCAHAHIRTRGSLWRVVVGEGERRPTGKCRWRRGPAGRELCQQGMQVGQLWLGGAGGHVQVEGGW